MATTTCFMVDQSNSQQRQTNHLVLSLTHSMKAAFHKLSFHTANKLCG